MTGARKTAAAPFFWSLRRERMYRRCPRELFLDSYGGRGGHEPWGEPGRRLIHRLKQLRTVPDFCRRLTAEVLRACFLAGAGEEEFPETFDRRFRRMLEQRWKQLRREILLGDPDLDHRIPQFAEPEAARSYEWLFRAVEEECGRLTGNDLFADLAAELGAVPPLDIVPPPSPFEVQLAELTVYTGTLLAWRRGDRIRFLSLVNGEDAERDEIYRVIEQYFAWNRLKIPPERVDSVLADFGAARRYDYTGAAAEAGRVVDRILASAAEIAVRLDRDGGADPEAFPMIEDCPPECRFYRFCRPS